MLRQIISSNLLRNVSKSFIAPTNLLHTSQINQKKKKDCCKPPPKKVAVILCGSGALDGTEISEAIMIAVHLSKNNLKPKFYAPCIDICGIVNHYTKDPVDGEKRNALIEAARLARGKIKPLSECNACDNSALIIPGGFGAVRTMSDFASKGCECVVLPELEKVIKEFSGASKPIGSLCIASAIIAKVLKAKVTLGKECPQDQWIYASAIEKVKQMGAPVEMTDVKGVIHCKQCNVYSNPAWLDSKATYADVNEGIGNMISMMSKCIK